MGREVGIAWADDEGGTQDSTVSTGLQITSQDGTTHTYDAHKLLSGTVQDGVLTNPSLQGCIPTSVYVEVGASEENVASAEALAKWLADAAANDADGTFAVALAKAVLQVESKKGLNPAETFQTGNAVELEAGYWLVTSDDAQPMLVPVSEGEVLEAQEKSSVPAATKVVGQSDAESTGAWEKSTSASVGDKVAYRLESTLPSNLAAFSSYHLWLCDELSSALEYDINSVSSCIVHADGTSEAIDLKVVINEHEMRVGADDLLKAVPSAMATDTVVVEYTCTVGASVSHGLSNGNDNTVAVEYQRSPTTDAVGTTKTTSVPSAAQVCCFQISLRQVDDDNDLLSDARFMIRNESGKYRTASESWSYSKADAQVIGTSENGLTSFTGLGTGSYTLIETEAPDGYKLITEPIVVNFAVVDAESESSALEAQAVDGAMAAGTGTMAAMANDDRTLTAKASGSGAKVIDVDAANGVVTVQVKGVSSGASEDDSKSGSSSSGSGSSSSSRSGSSVPSTGDLLFPVGVGLLIVSVGFIVVGALTRRVRRGHADNSHV